VVTLSFFRLISFRCKFCKKRIIGDYCNHQLGFRAHEKCHIEECNEYNMLDVNMRKYFSELYEFDKDYILTPMNMSSGIMVSGLTFASNPYSSSNLPPTNSSNWPPTNSSNNPVFLPPFTIMAQIAQQLMSINYSDFIHKVIKLFENRVIRKSSNTNEEEVH
jgi:hypothetical protein